MPSDENNILKSEKRANKSRVKLDVFNEANPDLPGSDTMVRLAEHEVNSFPSGYQAADNPTLNPPYHNSPDARASKRFHPSEINGWAADLEKSKRPGYPKERMPARPIGVHWEQPEAQIPRVEIFHSVERAGITPVFGSTCPPRGVSGFLREKAYLKSENDIRHWLILMAADRVDEVEGLMQDLSRGHVPNLFKEMGLKAELKHRPLRFVAKTALLVGAVSLGVMLFKNKRAAYFSGNKGGRIGQNRTGL
ncbi:MAG: hypothetical protein H7333_04795 [Bdellovibrionales bacterium]|nr:hypothetical protein [Oligoflexia bacterium]